MKFFFSALAVAVIFACEQRPRQEQIPKTKKEVQTITEQEALDFVARYDSAWNAKDSLSVKELLCATYLYFDSQGGTTPRENTLSIVAAPHYKVLSAKREEIEVLIHENVAIINSRWIGNGLWKDKPFNDNQRCGLTLAKTNGKIKLIAEHCVEIKK